LPHASPKTSTDPTQYRLGRRLSSAPGGSQLGRLIVGVISRLGAGNKGQAKQGETVDDHKPSHHYNLPSGHGFRAATDLFSMRVPDYIVPFGRGLRGARRTGRSRPNVGLHVPLVAAALIVAFALCSFGWIGGGDAKLFAATCLWFEPEAILIYSLYAALIAGMLTLLIIFLRNMPLLSMLSGKGWLVRLHEPRGGIPTVSPWPRRDSLSTPTRLSWRAGRLKTLLSSFSSLRRR
jgi:prepilin peptidase CpaA